MEAALKIDQTHERMHNAAMGRVARRSSRAECDYKTMKSGVRATATAIVSMLDRRHEQLGTPSVQSCIASQWYALKPRITELVASITDQATSSRHLRDIHGVSATRNVLV